MELSEILQIQGVRDLIALGIAVAGGALATQLVNVAKAEAESMEDDE
jgi:hypothetical protein